MRNVFEKIKNRFLRCEVNILLAKINVTTKYANLNKQTKF